MAVWIVLGQTLGRIPFLGIVVMVVVGLAAVGTTVAWIAVGMVRVLAGQEEELPGLGRAIRHCWK